MKALEIIAEVEQRGGTLTLRGGKIRYRVPRSIAERITAELRAHREEVLAALQKRQDAPPRATPQAHRAPERGQGYPAAPQLEGLAECGDPHCNGCYEVIPSDGDKASVKLHQPRTSESYLAWLEKWKPKGKVQ